MQNKQLNIGFFGHSNCATEGEGTYLTIVSDYFDAKIVNKGVGQASEERLLSEIKKSKNLDIAVIFHGRPASLYLPKCTRDIDIRTDEVKAYRGTYGNISSIFDTEEEFITCLKYYKTYLHDHDLARNRFQGALLLIDSYCRSKVPITVHVLYEELPWFTEFTSGIRARQIESLVRTHAEHNSPNSMTIEGNKEVAEILIDLITQQLADK